jgi:hypothetical protein
MAARRFKSKVDRWIQVLLVIIIVGQAFAVGSAAIQAGDPLVMTGLILVMIIIAALMIWLLTGTYYTVDRGFIRIASGPFRWNIPIDKITAIEETRSPLSSPALSLDRIRIRYGKWRQVMISPADKAGFLKAIGRPLDQAPTHEET